MSELEINLCRSAYQSELKPKMSYDCNRSGWDKRREVYRLCVLGYSSFKRLRKWGGTESKKAATNETERESGDMVSWKPSEESDSRRRKQTVGSRIANRSSKRKTETWLFNLALCGRTRLKRLSSNSSMWINGDLDKSSFDGMVGIDAWLECAQGNERKNW